MNLYEHYCNILFEIVKAHIKNQKLRFFNKKASRISATGFFVDVTLLYQG